MIADGHGCDRPHPIWAAWKAACDDARMQSTATALRMNSMTVDRGLNRICGPIDLTIGRGEFWIVLGPNGSGKSTLAAVAAMRGHPTTGSIVVLGAELGKIDLRVHRRRVGYLSAALIDQVRPDAVATDVVMTALNDALDPWWHTYTESDREAALAALAIFGVKDRADRTIGTMSSGEIQRCLLARSIVTSPGLVVLDEPSARLDLGGREGLISALCDLHSHDPSRSVIEVTHHVDEIPPIATHALVMHSGVALASGPIEEVVTGDVLSSAFDVQLKVTRDQLGRFSARRDERPR